MKKRSIFGILVVWLLAFAGRISGQTSDTFSDADFTRNPSWTGDTAHFEVNSAGQLHLASSGSDTSVLSVQFTAGREAQWDFWLKMSFNTSSNNYARAYLSADTSDLLRSLHSLYLQAGGSDDSIRLVSRSPGSEATLYSFSHYRTNRSVNTIRFRITCDTTGLWVFRSDTTGGHSFFTDGSVKGSPVQAGGWFGFLCRYTASNATKFYFDDMYAGPVVRDTTSPGLVSLLATDDRTVRCRFTEPVDPAVAADPGHYRFGLLPAPDSVRIDPLSACDVRLHLPTAPPNGTRDRLSVSGIRDLQGNQLRDTSAEVCFYRPGPFDILIDEIMADPEPPVSLPAGEYAELYNRTEFPVSLQGWQLRYGSSQKVLPDLVIPPGGYLLVAKDSAFLDYASCVLVFTSSTSLSNEGTTLTLLDRFSHVIHSVTYDPAWYGRSFKADGGWSLEMADPANPCGCAGNWEPSKDPHGGTPGKANSCRRENPDEVQPRIIAGYITDSVTLLLGYSEAMDSTSFPSAEAWTLNGAEDPGHPAQVRAIPPDFSKAELRFATPFSRGTIYRISGIPSLKDCAGNTCDTAVSVRTAIPDSLRHGDLVINEILPDPATGGVRFAELYNRSERVIDLLDAVLSDGTLTGGDASQAEPLVSEGLLMFPGDLRAFSPDPGDLALRFRSADPDRITRMASFPTLDADSGTVILARRDNLAIIDAVHYDAAMHYPYLAATDGVSLERLSPELPSGDRGNWHSAAEPAGFGTPGAPNSHGLPTGNGSGVLTVEPPVFSPDNDGKDDILTIGIRSDDPSCAVTVTVFDSHGRIVARPASNVLAGAENLFTWDGFRADGTKAPIGIYAVLAEILQGDGRLTRLRKAAVLAARL